ncbi:MAG TPA: T9SS type A sorting domain-containing protein [Rubricoccaceae bacterium]|jgi:hypothetical protein
MPLLTPRAAFAAALLGLPLAASAQPAPPPSGSPVGSPTIDGQFSTAEGYTLLDDNTGGPASGFGTENQVAALYAYVDDVTNSLYVGVAGNIGNNNRLLVFVDSRAGGYSDGGFADAPGAPGGVNNFNTGNTFDIGFTADFAIAIGTDDSRSDFYVNVTEFAGTPGAGASTDRYIGSANGSPDIAVPASFPTNVTSTTTGFEIRIPLGATASASTPLASDRRSMQFFGLVTSDGGFLSNSFISPAGAGDGNYGSGAVNFEMATPDPVSYVWQPIAGRKGWRQLAWPVTGGTVASLAPQNHVQGPNTNHPSGSSNVILSLDPTLGYRYANALTDQLVSGRGFFWYHYDAVDFPQGPPSDFRPLPYTLRAGGVEPQANVSTFFVEAAQSGQFLMAGNPYSLDFDTQGLTGSQLAPLVYVWDPDAGTAGGYVAVDRNSPVQADRTVAPMQGFWIQIAPTPAALGGFTFQYLQSARIQGNEPIIALTAAQRVLGFQLDRLTAEGPVSEWRTARLAFVDGAGEGLDVFDAGLPPSMPSGAEARIAFVGTRDGAADYRGQDSRAYTPQGAVEASLAFFAAGRPDGATYRLTWPTMEAIPAEWSLTLRDGDTGETVDLRTADHLDFTASATDWASRFTVRVAARTTADEDTPAQARLGAATPNPASDAARVALTVDQPQHIRAELYDALGRRVAVVLDATVDASRDLIVDTRGLAPGIYVLRVSGDTFAASQRVTVAR